MSSVSGLKDAPSTVTERPARLPPQSSAARFTVRPRWPRLTASTSCIQSATAVTPRPARLGPEAADVLGQAAAAETEPGVQVPPADPRVHAHRLAQLRDVRAGGVAEPGDGIDEADLGGQVGVRGRFDEFGGGEVAHHTGNSGGEQRLIDRIQGGGHTHGCRRPGVERCGPAAVHPVDQPVRHQRVLHRGALPEELRIPAQQDIRPGAQHAAEHVRRAHGHGRFSDDDGARGQVRQQRLRGRGEIGEVGGVGRFVLGRSHAQEVHLRAPGVGRPRGEGQPARGEAILQQLLQAGLVERRHAAGQLVHFGGVDVDARHRVAHGRQRGGVDGAEIAAADDGDLHSIAPSALIDRGPGPAARGAAARAMTSS
jgi:hypothetical protein